MLFLYNHVHSLETLYYIIISTSSQNFLNFLTFLTHYHWQVSCFFFLYCTKVSQTTKQLLFNVNFVEVCWRVLDLFKLVYLYSFFFQRVESLFFFSIVYQMIDITSRSDISIYAVVNGPIRIGRPSPSSPIFVRTGNRDFFFVSQIQFIEQFSERGRRCLLRAHAGHASGYCQWCKY